MISTAEALETALAPAVEASKATQKASGAKRTRNVAPSSASRGRRPPSLRKRPRARRKPPAPATAARPPRFSIC